LHFPLPAQFLDMGGVKTKQATARYYQVIALGEAKTRIRCPPELRKLRNKLHERKFPCSFPKCMGCESVILAVTRSLSSFIELP
jgi:hypothetical protein